VVSVLVSINIYIDIFGLFRRIDNRKVAIYGEERIAKYLYSFRYIPENFDGVLLGSSVSENFDLTMFPGYRIYNLSINGGNVADLKPLVENICHKREFKLSMIAIHRYLTKDHVKKTDFMTPRQYWSALGSPQLGTAYAVRIAVRLNLVRALYNDRGTLLPDSDPDTDSSRAKIEQTVIDIRRGTAAVGDYSIDPVALEELNEILGQVRSHSGRVVIFYPPTPGPVLAECAAKYARYRDTVNALTKPSDIVVDFNKPEYEQFRSNFANFTDGVHLSAAGARAVVVELSRIVEQSNLQKVAEIQ